MNVEKLLGSRKDTVQEMQKAAGAHIGKTPLKFREKGRRDLMICDLHECESFIFPNFANCFTQRSHGFAPPFSKKIALI
jgi:hypothetical protein